MVVLETIDHDMMDIIEKCPHVPTFDETKDGVKTSVIKKTTKHLFCEEDKRLHNLNFQAHIVIGNYPSYDIYHLVLNCVFTKEMMDTLTVMYEGTKEVKSTRENNLNRK